MGVGLGTARDIILRSDMSQTPGYGMRDGNYVSKREEEEIKADGSK